MSVDITFVCSKTSLVNDLAYFGISHLLPEISLELLKLETGDVKQDRTLETETTPSKLRPRPEFWRRDRTRQKVWLPDQTEVTRQTF